jgi:hypothetical protein
MPTGRHLVNPLAPVFTSALTENSKFLLRILNICSSQGSGRAFGPPSASTRISGTFKGCRSFKSDLIEKRTLRVQANFKLPVQIGETEIDIGWLNDKPSHSAAQRRRWAKSINAQFWRVMGRSRTATFLRLEVRRWRRASARIGASVARQ